MIHINIPGFEEALTDAVYGERTVSVALAEIRPVVQSFMDEAYDQQGVSPAL